MKQHDQAGNEPHDDGKICRACARPVYRCLNCRQEFYPMRLDALTCSLNCRAQRTYNRKHRTKYFAGKDAS